MRREIKKLPKEMQEAYKNLQKRPDENTPAAIMEFMDENKLNQNIQNNFLINTVVDFANPNLLDLELDDRENDDGIYAAFALEVLRKVMGYIDPDMDKHKESNLYLTHNKVRRLKAREFSTIGDLEEKSLIEQAGIFADFYGIESDEKYTSLSKWEQELFAVCVKNRADTNVEKR